MRELRNVIEWAIILSGGEGTIKLRHVMLPEAAAPRVTLPFEREVKLEDVKRTYASAGYRKYSGRRSRLSRAPGISERNLYRLLHEHGLE